MQKNLCDLEVSMPNSRHHQSTEGIPESFVQRKRKLYLRNPECSIPRQTRWYREKRARSENLDNTPHYSNNDTGHNSSNLLPNSKSCDFTMDGDDAPLHSSQSFNDELDGHNSSDDDSSANSSQGSYIEDNSPLNLSFNSSLNSVSSSNSDKESESIASSSCSLSHSLHDRSSDDNVDHLSLSQMSSYSLDSNCVDDDSLVNSGTYSTPDENAPSSNMCGIESDLTTAAQNQTPATTSMNHAEIPLYPGATISCRESWSSIYKFSVTNRLSDSATQNLLKLISSHCPTPNLCPQTVYKLKKQVGPLDCIRSQYCSLCMNEVPPDEKKCGSCKGQSSHVCYYVLMPFEEHLKEIFSDNWEKVNYPFTRPLVSGAYNDIQDGERYKRQSQPGKFFSVPEHTGLILCADGVPLFKSSGQSLWPVQLCITNLPPDIRMDLRYLLLAGVWLGPVKPDMSILLKPILERIHTLYEKGISISTPAGPKCLRAKLLCCVFDLPARAMALNLSQWNGRYGCTHCVDEGTQVSHVRLYLPGDTHSARSEKHTLECARSASSSLPVFGVKGISVLSPYINIVKDTTIDYMHAVLEGVAKTMLRKFWLCGKYKDYRFYLFKEIKQIDKVLLRIRPPHEFRRTPRSLEKTHKYWKASELRAWLLFYCIPILFKFLPCDYLHHLNLLVKAVHILLSSHILCYRDLSTAENMLTVFYKKIVDLYPQEICTMNVHSLIHLVQNVRNFGPLWAYSCFGFENMNGHLKKHCHGTRNVLPQLVRNLRFHQATLDQEYNAENHEDGIRGRVKNRRLCTEYLEALREGNYSTSNPIFPVFPRYKFNGVLYQTWKSSKQLRNSSVCKFRNVHGITQVGSIRCFCLCDKVPVAIIAVFGAIKDAFEEVQNATIPELNTFSLTNSCVFKVDKLSVLQQFQATPVSSIAIKCVHIAMKSKPFDFIVPMPNSYEHH